LAGEATSVNKIALSKSVFLTFIHGYLVEPSSLSGTFLGNLVSRFLMFLDSGHIKACVVYDKNHSKVGIRIRPLKYYNIIRSISEEMHYYPSVASKVIKMVVK